LGYIKGGEVLDQLSDY